jgi:hypothetical protein
VFCFSFQTGKLWQGGLWGTMAEIGQLRTKEIFGVVGFRQGEESEILNVPRDWFTSNLFSAQFQDFSYLQTFRVG